ncbi:MAG: hypothetical protein ACRC0X_09460 [Brevinema sp.]
MNEKWQSKIEKDIQGLTLSINKLVVSLDHFIQHSKEIKEIQGEKFAQLKEILEDHEHRIRYNTKFVYQTMAGVSLLSIIIGYVMKLI